MTDITIPGWAIGLMGSFGMLALSWLLWLTVEVFKNRQATAINTTNDEARTKEFANIYSAINDIKSDVKNLTTKIDQMIMQEMQLLKSRLNPKGGG